MKTAVRQENGITTLEDRPVPRLKDPRGVIIKVALTTICSSNIHIEYGAVPRAVLGTALRHEFVGMMEQIGETVRRFEPGDRVAVNVETFCEECCFRKRNYVSNYIHGHGGWALGCRIDGGQAGCTRVPFADNRLTRIPGEATDEAALFIGDILSTSYWEASLTEIKPADMVAVTGVGPTRLRTLTCARSYGPGIVIAIGTFSERLELAKEQGLAGAILNPFEQDMEREIRNLALGRDTDAVLEVVGGRDIFQTAWKIARPDAMICVVALYEEPQMLLLPDMYGENLAFRIGGVNASCCEEIMRLVGTGKPDTSCLVTHRVKLENIMEAHDVFEDRRNHVIKYAIEISQGRWVSCVT